MFLGSVHLLFETGSDIVFGCMRSLVKRTALSRPNHRTLRDGKACSQVECVNLDLLFLNKLFQTRYLESDIRCCPVCTGTPEYLQGWFWLKVSHEAAVIGERDCVLGVQIPRGPLG